MRFLRFASIGILLLWGCARIPYRKLPQVARTTGSAQLLQPPKIERELYRCVVDGKFLFKRFHLSGILLFKSFEDGSQRAVFQNEMGISFFNFKWTAQDSFSVTSVMSQLDKPALIRTLRTDFELLLRKNLDTSRKRFLDYRNEIVVEVGKNAGFAWYRRKSPQIMYGGKSPVASISSDSLATTERLPSNIRIEHHKARFTIDLKRIAADDN